MMHIEVEKKRVKPHEKYVTSAQQCDKKCNKFDVRAWLGSESTQWQQVWENWFLATLIHSAVLHSLLCLLCSVALSTEQQLLLPYRILCQFQHTKTQEGCMIATQEGCMVSAPCECLIPLAAATALGVRLPMTFPPHTGWWCSAVQNSAVVQ